MPGLSERFPSLTARLTNSGRFSPKLAARFTRLHAKVFRATNGRVGKRYFGSPVIVLEIVGRKSGQLRATPVIRCEHEGGFLVVPGNGGQSRTPAWWLNLMAAGEATVIADGRRRRMRPRVLEPAERERLWPLAERAWPPLRDYGRFTDREFPLALLEPV